MSETDDIQAARNILAAELDAQVSTFQDALVRVWRQLDRSLRGLVEDAAAGSTSAIIRAARAGRLKAAIETAFNKAGWSDLIDYSTGVKLDAVVTNVETLRLAAQVVSFGAADTAKIEALKVLSATDLIGEGQAVATELWKATVQGVFSSRPAAQIVDDLAELLDRSVPAMRTLFDTSISVFARQVESLSVPQEPERPFVYTGPNDDKVRPFCLEHLGKVYTREAIDALDNGQLPNVFLTCGGYNCRHGWTAVSKFSSLAPLANTGQRVPAFSRGIEDGGSKAA